MLDNLDSFYKEDNMNGNQGIKTEDTNLQVNKILEKNMNKEQIEKNIGIIQKIYKEKKEKLYSLKKGYKEAGEEQEFLDNILDIAGIEAINDKARYVIYNKFISFKKDGLEDFLKSIGKKEDEIYSISDKINNYLMQYYNNYYEEIISDIEKKKLLTPFYLNILKGVHSVGNAMNKFHISWDKYLIRGINKDLENDFNLDTDAIFKYLEENDLFDKGHNGEQADRSYSVLSKKDDKSFEVLTYSQAFPKEITEIVNQIDIFIYTLELEEDAIYNAKEDYIKYLNKIKEAFLEISRHNLVQKWSEVDEAWMSIKTPFQIGHPLEFYEDNYRKAVAVEWDIRLQDFDVMNSKVVDDIDYMYEELFDEIGKDKYSLVYKKSKENFKRTQLYICTQLFSYGSCYDGGTYSAQVVPNDEEVTKSHGKKIFGVPADILKGIREADIKKLTTEYFDEKLLKKYYNYIDGKDSNYYNVYDIETFGHEFGHTLWLDMDTESIMNKTGNFKNIEEFKATTGAIVSYLYRGVDENRENLLMDHIMRAVKLIGRQEVEEVNLYYCEGLIQLKIFFDTGILFLNPENKLEIDFSMEVYKKFKYEYISYYKKLIKAYLEKQDASIFLNDYVIKQGKIFLPKDDKIREFVVNYYKRKIKIGNEVDETFER